MGIFKKESTQEKEKRQEERQEKWKKEFEEQIQREKEEKEEKEKILNDIEFYKNNSKKVFKFGLYRYVVLTNDDKIVFIYDEDKPHKQEQIKTIDKIIDINDILKVDIICHTKTKQVRQWWNIVLFTMEEKQQLEYMEFKVITLDGIFRFILDVNAYIKSNGQQYADNLEILMTYLERKINNNNI